MMFGLAVFLLYVAIMASCQTAGYGQRRMSEGRSPNNFWYSRLK